MEGLVVNWIGAALPLVGSAFFAFLAASGFTKSQPVIICSVALSGFFVGILITVLLSRKICKEFGNLVVISARWGSDDHDIDVTPQIAGQIRNNKLRVIHVNNTAMHFQDPHPGTPKKLTVTYAFTGIERIEIVPENDSVGLRLP